MKKKDDYKKYIPWYWYLMKIIEDEKWFDRWKVLKESKKKYTRDFNTSILDKNESKTHMKNIHA